MSDCVRKMTQTEKAKFIMATLEHSGYNMQQWERDYLKSVLQEKIDILPYMRKQGYQPNLESINNILPSTDSSVQNRAKMNKQCYMLTCRYNSNTKCISEKDYQKCTNAVKKVLGEDKYGSFLKWEKLEVESNMSDNNIE